MKANAIICEYNPFHNGHKYQIERIRENSDNPIVAIMSGNFTQRGDVAIKNKFVRAEYALKNGIDLVLELPTVYATSNAETFAKAGVMIADAMGCVENLCFSTESDNYDLLFTVRDAFDNDEFLQIIKTEMSNGSYYPKAIEVALEKKYSINVSEIIKEPNNVLGVEYLKALKSTEITPMIIKRIGVGHDEEKCRGNITSASNIRKLIKENNSYIEFIPSNNINFNNYADIDNVEKVLLYKLRSMNKNDFATLPDVNEGLEHRIANSVANNNSIKEIIENIKTKRYTMARIRRILICALLNITKELVKTPVPYIRVLAFNKAGEQILKEIKKNGNLPLITNVAEGYNSLDEKSKKIFDIDIFASDIYPLACTDIDNTKKDFTNGIIKI